MTSNDRDSEAGAEEEDMQDLGHLADYTVPPLMTFPGITSPVIGSYPIPMPGPLPDPDPED